MEQDEMMMRRVLDLAALGRGLTNPNPMVGAIVVKDGIVLGEAFHEEYGGKHAERLLLDKLRIDLSEATLYVNLEPCCHWGKTPPCTEIIISKGIGRVVVGALDPNPKVNGGGVRTLREAGITVKIEVLEEECLRLNRVFYHYMKTKRPFVTMKYAMTTDGKIATTSGESQWITGALSRERVHRIRHENLGIMVGIGTVLSDDPMLDCRMVGGRNGVRIVCDSHLRIPMNSRLVKTAKEIPLIIATEEGEGGNRNRKKEELEESGCLILPLRKVDGHLDLMALMEELGRRNLDSVLLEGGGILNEAALQSGIVDKIQVFMAPMIFGGQAAKSPVEGNGVRSLKEAFQLHREKVEWIGDDLFIEYLVIKEGENVYRHC